MEAHPSWTQHGPPQINAHGQMAQVPVTHAPQSYLGSASYAYPDNYQPHDNASSSSDPRHAPPLKRGDACLYCRRRRIRCSATKPQCHHCAKLKRECVYDVGKPVSRVRKLENKIAELEGYIRQSNAAAATTLVGAPSSVSGLPGGVSIDGAPTPSMVAPGPSPQIPMVPMNVAPIPMGGNVYQPSQQPLPPSQPQPQFLNPQTPHTAYSYGLGSLDQSTVDITTLDDFQPAPGMRSFADRMGVSVSDTADFSNASREAASYDWDTVDDSYVNLVYKFSETASPSQEDGLGRDIHRVPQQQRPKTSQANFISYLPPKSVPAGATAANPDLRKGMYRSGEVNVAYVTVADEPDGDTTVVGGWHDANSMPKAARDELLGKFFDNMRVISKGINIPRFMASLALPISKRPHPCLLYAIYAFVARFSDSEKLSRLQNHFHDIAAAQLHEAVSKVDRVLDAVRAATVLALFYYSQTKYHAGAMMTSHAARLALDCGLHQIPLSEWKPSSLPSDAEGTRLLGMMRRRGFLLPPPQDAVEHGERIWAFWNVYLVDRISSIGTQWPPNIHDDDVSTPFPKELYEYELGLVSTKDDYSVASLYDDGPQQALPYHTETSGTILQLKALTLLEHCSKLTYRPAEPERHESSWGSGQTIGLSPVDFEEYLSRQSYYAANPLVQSPKARENTREPRLRTPRAYERYRTALLRLENELPPEYRTAWGTWDGHGPDWVFQAPNRSAITLHFTIGCAWMMLTDTCSYSAPNVEAVACARRIAFIARVLLPDRLLLDFQVFMSMCLSQVSIVLIREVKRLQGLGEAAQAESINEDFETVLAALKVRDPDAPQNPAHL